MGNHWESSYTHENKKPSGNPPTKRSKGTMQTNYDKVMEFNKRVAELRREYNLPGVTVGGQWRLIEEEYKEVSDAVHNYTLVPTDEFTAELVKELCDLLYVTYGMLAKLHGNTEAVFDLVHANNMRKFGEGAHFNVSGKLMKPEGFLKLTNDDILGALNSDEP